MPELRFDPLKKTWVIISTERAKRPHDFSLISEEKKEEGECPFCPGNEDKTPPEIFAIREEGSKPNEPGWSIRVIPNKYPALRLEGKIEREGIGLYDRMSGVGAHEVIIESPEHGKSLADLPLEQIVKVLTVYKLRLKSLRADERFRYVLIFRNYRSIAGASLSHPHSQIIATPVTPKVLKEELSIAREHFSRKERCIFCDILRDEMRFGDRIVKIHKNYVLFTPFASCFPFECRLYPLRHSYDFAEIPDEELPELALALKDMLLRIKLALNDPPYNFVIHTAPSLHPRPGKPDYWGTIKEDFHWHIELVPRLTIMAGFEWGTGFYINPTPPEEAAKYLREVDNAVEGMLR